MAATEPDPAAWGLPACRVESIAGGNRARVLRTRGLDRDWVFKTTTRSEDQLAWVAACRRALSAAGIAPALPHPTRDGLHSHGGWTAEPFIRSRPLQAGERNRFRAMLRRLQKIAFGMGQRPGFENARNLMKADKGGDIDVTHMPANLVARCRAAFAGIPSAPLTLCHGDLNRANVGIKPSGQFVIFDWDEARVDHPLFDLVAIGALDHPVPRRAALAYEILTCWHREPDRAKKLAERF